MNKQKMNITKLFHVFMIFYQREWCVIPKVYDEEEFDTFMDKLGWYMPFGLSAYHFHMDNKPEIDQVKTLESKKRIQVPLEKLLHEKSVLDMRLKSNIYQQDFNILSKVGDFVFIDYEAPYNKVLFVNGVDSKYIADLSLKPISLKDAKKYVNEHHRHNVAALGHKFSISLVDTKDKIRGVVIASTPKARYTAKDQRVLEINRCCTDERYFNACSKLYSAAINTGRGMGYDIFVTYTLPEESGSSLKAVGFEIDGIVRESKEGWSVPSRPRNLPERYPTGEKIRWKLSKRR